MIRCASFDIGKKNFAFYIEEFDKTLLPTDIDCKYNQDGTAQECTITNIDKVFMNGTTIIHRNYNLETCQNNDIKGDKNIVEDSNEHKYIVYYNLVKILDNYKEYWDTCKYFIIEQQMCFQNVRNVMAVKIGQHCFSYFCIKHGRGDNVIEFPAYHKTKVLGAPKIKGNKIYKNGNHNWKSMTKPNRKKWAIQIATSILEKRKEANLMILHKKKDDFADTLVQLQAFKILHYCTK